MNENHVTPSSVADLRMAETNAAAVDPSNPMDTLASEYDRWFDSPEGRQLFEVELACVREVMGTAQGRWLEVGVGTGRFAEALGIHEGVDPSEPAIQFARRRGINAVLGTAEQLPFSAALFDGLLLVTSLCFVSNPKTAIKELRRVIKPGGVLVIGMIPRDSPWGLRYGEKAREGHPFYSAAHFHTSSEVIDFAEGVGFCFQVASSCLLSSPQCPPTSQIEQGIAGSAGFVCLRFSALEFGS